MEVRLSSGDGYCHWGLRFSLLPVQKIRLVIGRRPYHLMKPESSIALRYQPSAYNRKRPFSRMDAAPERTWMYSQRVWNDYKKTVDLARRPE